MKKKIHSVYGLSALCTTLLLSACGTRETSSSNAQNACLDQMTTAIATVDQEEAERSKKLDPAAGNVRPGNESLILKGDPQRVVFLLHGYLASPFEVKPLALALHAQGYTVVAPLLAGFGRSTLVAASTGPEEWISSAQKQLQAAELCGKNIQVVGFSLGALVETKILLENAELRAKVASFTLISPALKIRDNSLMSITFTLFRVLNSTPSIPFLASAARKMGNHDLDIPESHPEAYNSEIPLVTVKELNRLAGSVDFRQFSNFGPSVKVVYSESDHTVDGFTSSNMISQYLPSLSVYAFPAAAGVNHQILLSDVPYAVDQTIVEVQKNFK